MVNIRLYSYPHHLLGKLENSSPNRETRKIRMFGEKMFDSYFERILGVFLVFFRNTNLFISRGNFSDRQQKHANSVSLESLTCSRVAKPAKYPRNFCTTAAAGCQRFGGITCLCTVVLLREDAIFDRGIPWYLRNRVTAMIQ